MLKGKTFFNNMFKKCRTVCFPKNNVRREKKSCFSSCKKKKRTDRHFKVLNLANKLGSECFNWIRYALGAIDVMNFGSIIPI